ncbi:hypothetical protein [Acidianus manzaensis]|uniref:Uncharacterized protein n=1 Tax=Acidianus manzaensis TaxID=282676 RepID=A0A1W6JYD2_9CREN|nr:hypothetical protein [Acidianus manzaensis]ARM75257.1 hypothetical protein B6F84_03905 [Acidianus manzaensis]
MKRYTFYISNDLRRQIYSEALKYLSPQQIRSIIGEQKKSMFWKSRSKVSDESIEKLIENLPLQVKLEVLSVIEKDLKEALDAIEREKKQYEESIKQK